MKPIEPKEEIGEYLQSNDNPLGELCPVCDEYIIHRKHNNECGENLRTERIWVMENTKEKRKWNRIKFAIRYLINTI
jgi:hypothetical protein